MEKSFLSFTARYPTWEPGESGREMLRNVRRFRESEPAGVPDEADAARDARGAASGAGFEESYGRFPSPDGGSVFGGAFDGRAFDAGIFDAETPDARAPERSKIGKIGFFGHGRVVFDAGGGEGGRADAADAPPDERREAESQALLQRAYESRAFFQTASRDGRDGRDGRSGSGVSSGSRGMSRSSVSDDARTRSALARDAPDAKRRGPAETEMSVSVSVSPPARPAPPLFDAPPNLWELEAEEDPSETRGKR
jgi:hypothetical protein